MKKLLLLGGSRYIIPVIKVAHELGLYVITCDYLKDNVAHKYSDEYKNLSIIDKDSVLNMVYKSHIDGIMSFACDPGVLTAAYVAEKLGLPFQGSYESVKILQDKGRFRQFLMDHNFNTPRAKCYTDPTKPFEDLDYFQWPVIVKPTDSAGSKGVNRVDEPKNLVNAIATAIEKSHNGSFIIEDFLSFRGYHSSADVFTVSGNLNFVSYSDQLFDTEADNKYTPDRIIWPTTMSKEYQNYLTNETQRLMDLLKMDTGIYNIESCVGIDGKPYLMEVSPRGGGCKIAEIQQLAMDVRLIENEIRSSVGMPLIEFEEKQCEGVWCENVIHAAYEQTGILNTVVIDPDIKKRYVKMVDLAVKKGDLIKPFTGANMSLGDIFLHFDSREELDRIMRKKNDWLKIDMI